MAHTKVIERKERLMDQLAKGYRTRYVVQQPVSIATARGAVDATNDPVADVIRAETKLMAIMIAPCDSKILRCFVNADQFPVQGTTVTVKFSKAVVGGDVDLTAATTIDNLTVKVAVDFALVATAGVQDLVEGQLVYATIVVSNNAVTAKSIGLSIGVEYMPTEA
jgi:hypothetical protein